MPSPLKRRSERRRAIGGLIGLPWAMAAAGWLAACADASPPPVGRPLAAFSLDDLDGVSHRAHELAGAPLLLNVWASWCPPCRAEMAGLQRLYRDFRSRGLALLAVSTDDDRNLVREYLRRGVFDFPVWHDPGGRAMAALLGTPAIPASLLVDGRGVVRRREIGERDWDAVESRAWVTALLS